MKSGCVTKLEPELRHSAEINSHLDAADDFRSEDVAGCARQQVDRLDDVQKHLKSNSNDFVWRENN